VGVIGYKDLDHAVAMGQRFPGSGLSGWVHGADKVKALDVGLRIRSGSVNVNGRGDVPATAEAAAAIKMRRPRPRGA